MPKIILPKKYSCIYILIYRLEVFKFMQFCISLSSTINILIYSPTLRPLSQQLRLFAAQKSRRHKSCKSLMVYIAATSRHQKCKCAVTFRTKIYAYIPLMGISYSNILLANLMLNICNPHLQNVKLQ